MPTYNYVCKECDAPLEVRQSMSDDRLVECPKCKKQSLKKVIVPNTGGVQFKGKGWFNSGGY